MFGGGAGGVGQVAGVARHVVMVRNLPPRAGELDVAAAMGRCGRVKSARIFNRYRVGEDEVRPLSIQSIDRSIDRIIRLSIIRLSLTNGFLFFFFFLP